jgi:hypothetical protein
MQRNRAAIYRRVLESQSKGRIRLYLLLNTAFLIGGQVRLGQRLAKLFSAANEGFNQLRQ